VLADAVLLVHLGFIVFAVSGALCVVRHPWLAWLHVPAALWAGCIGLAGWICPLTPLENALRARAGEGGYARGFVAHWVEAWIYPPGLTPALQMALGVGVLALNAALYVWIIARARARGSPSARGAS
jgi:hypothetical protein